MKGNSRAAENSESFWRGQGEQALAVQPGSDLKAMRYRLPPMNALRVFEAARRHMSFKDAARGLDITPSAVSYGVRTLEGWLGQPLFSRCKQGLLLTKAGAR